MKIDSVQFIIYSVPDGNLDSEEGLDKFLATIKRTFGRSEACKALSKVGYKVTDVSPEGTMGNEEEILISMSRKR